MKVHFWCIGKTDDAWIAQGSAIYQKRLVHYINFNYTEIILSKGKKLQNPEAHQEAEKDEILKLLKPNDTLVLLDEAGKEYNSTGFSVFLQKLFNESAGSIVFLSGGAYGFHSEIYARANHTLALSKMTFTHQMVRPIFLEQLYRGMTILKGEPYHH